MAGSSNVRMRRTDCTASLMVLNTSETFQFMSHLDCVYVSLAFSGGILPRIWWETSAKFPAQDACFASTVVPRATTE
jgi:hypothetical protein